MRALLVNGKQNVTVTTFQKKNLGVETAVKRKIEDTFNQPCSSKEQKMCNEHCMPEVIKDLKIKYAESSSRTEKIQLLTIFSKRMTKREMMDYFKCSSRMALQARKLREENSSHSKHKTWQETPNRNKSKSNRLL